MERISANAIVITGVGMNTSLGDAVTACAAARAGLSAAREISDFTVLCNDGSDGKVCGHPIETVAGFRGLGKALALGLPALRDLTTHTDLEAMNPKRLGLCLGLPELESRSIVRELALPEPQPLRVVPSIGEALCAKLTSLSSLEIPLEHQNWYAQGNAAFGPALSRAMSYLSSGKWDASIVGGIDSLLEESTLDWLHHWGRLKTDDKPDGTVPGEAAAFLLVERLDAAQRRGVKAMARLDRVMMEQEEDHCMSGKPSRGLGLGKGILAAAAAIKGRAQLISDLNGEHYRAQELANARLWAGREHSWLLDCTVECPAANFGDTGAACGALGLGLSARGFALGYMPLGERLMLLSSDRGLRSVVVISGVE